MCNVNPHLFFLFFFLFTPYLYDSSEVHTCCRVQCVIPPRSSCQPALFSSLTYPHRMRCVHVTFSPRTQTLFEVAALHKSSLFCFVIISKQKSNSTNTLKLKIVLFAQAEIATTTDNCCEISPQSSSSERSPQSSL